MRLIRAGFILLCAFFVLLLLVLSGLFATAFYSQDGLTQVARYAMQFEPRLSLDEPTGTLFGPLAFASIRWEDSDINLRIDAVSVQLTPACLLSLQLCLRSVKIDKMTIDRHSATSSEPAEAGLALPEFSLPLPVFVSHFSANALLMRQDGAELLSVVDVDIDKLAWRGHDLSISTITAKAFDERMRGSLKLTLAKDYRLNASLAFKTQKLRDYYGYIDDSLGAFSPASGLAVSAAISGDLRHLRAELGFKGPVLLKANLEVDALAQVLPFSLRINKVPELRLQAQGQRVQLQKTDLTLVGDKKGLEYALKTSLSIPQIEGRAQVQLSGDTDYQSLFLHKGRLESLQGVLHADGVFHLAEYLSEDLDGGGDQQPGKQSVSQFNLMIEDLDPALVHPQYRGKLNARAMLSLSQSEAKAAADPLVSLSVSALNGMFMDRKLDSRGKLLWHSQHGLRFTRFRLNNGSDQLKLEGAFPDDSLTWSANIANTALYVPSLKAQLTAQGRVFGSLQKPSLTADLQLGDVVYEQYRAARIDTVVKINQLGWGDSEVSIHGRELGRESITNTVDMTLQLHARQEGAVSAAVIPGFAAQGVALGETLVAELALKVDQENTLRATLDCTPRINLRNYALRSDCQQAAIVVSEQFWHELPYTRIKPLPANGSIAEELQWESWSNDRPLVLDWSSRARQFSISPFCLRHGEAAVCLDDKVYSRPGSPFTLALSGRALPLGWAQYLLPTTYQLQGLWQFNAMLEEQVLPVDDVSGVEPGKQNESGAWLLSGELAAEQFQALLRVDDNKTLTLPIEQLKLKLRGDGLGFQSDFNFLSQTVGSMSGEFEYAGEELKGRARLENLQLKPFQGLSSDLTHLAGQLSGDLRFVLQESRPELFGDLDLQALSVESRSLPFALNKGNMSMQFQRQKLTLKGGMNLGSGYAAFSGNADWRNSDWRIALSSQASDIIIEPLPHSYARVVSDLTVLATPERVEIGGSVSIPEARVNVEKLPQNAVTVSDDSLIEEQQNDSLKSMHVTVDVKSTLGDDVQLRAYGLETRLQGQVRIRKKAGQLMTGNGVVNLIGGRYRAYGQDLILEEGRLIFAGPLSNPDIFVTAIRNHTADNVRVGVRASGPAKAPELSLFSTPQMAEQDLLYYLLTGKGPQSASVSQSRLATQTAIALGLAQSNRRAREIGESVGIKDFQLGADVGKQGDEIQLSGYVTPDLYLQYGVSVFDQLSAVTARYTLTPSVYVEIYSSTTSAIDVFWSIVKP